MSVALGLNFLPCLAPCMAMWLCIWIYGISTQIFYPHSYRDCEIKNELCWARYVETINSCVTRMSCRRSLQNTFYFRGSRIRSAACNFLLQKVSSADRPRTTLSSTSSLRHFDLVPVRPRVCSSFVPYLHPCPIRYVESGATWIQQPSGGLLPPAPRATHMSLDGAHEAS